MGDLKSFNGNSLSELLNILIDNDGSDLHLTVGSPPRIRVHGELQTSKKYDVIKTEDMNTLVFNNNNLDLKARSQVTSKGQHDTAIPYRHNEKLYRFRLNVFKQKGDTAAVFRILRDDLADIKTLGIPQPVQDLYDEHRGLILVVGPTGSGKSTTLASLIKFMNDNLPIHILTLEDPIEYVFKHNKAIVNQREVGTDVDSFADGLRAALREDPDVILVGEIRDEVTAEIALEAAETGHLVLSTLHTIGSVETVDRLISLFPPEKADMARMQIADTLKAVVSQQLLQKVGGGRIAVFETFFTDYDSCNLIRDKQHAKLREFMQSQKGRELGCSLMDANLLSLLQQNKITKESAISYAINRYDMRKTLERLNL